MFQRLARIHVALNDCVHQRPVEAMRRCHDHVQASGVPGKRARSRQCVNEEEGSIALTLLEMRLRILSKISKIRRATMIRIITNLQYLRN
jgi:hypothetical protein